MSIKILLGTIVNVDWQEIFVKQVQFGWWCLLTKIKVTKCFCNSVEISIFLLKHGVELEVVKKYYFSNVFKPLAVVKGEGFSGLRPQQADQITLLITLWADEVLSKSCSIHSFNVLFIEEIK